MKIEVGKKYKTRSGRIVKIKKIDKDFEIYPVYGEIEGEMREWNIEGEWNVDRTSSLDLISEHKPKKQKQMKKNKPLTAAQARKQAHKSFKPVKSLAEVEDLLEKYVQLGFTNMGLDVTGSKTLDEIKKALDKRKFRTFIGEEIQFDGTYALEIEW